MNKVVHLNKYSSWINMKRRNIYLIFIPLKLKKSTMVCTYEFMNNEWIICPLYAE